MLTEESLPNIIKTIQKKRTKENYQEILNDYLKNNSGILSTNRTNKINSSFFDNIKNNNLQKTSKLKNLLINRYQKMNHIILKEYFSKWRNKKKEKNEKIFEFELCQQKLNKNIKENVNNNSINENNDSTENKIEISTNKISEEINIFENDEKIQKQINELNDNIFQPYDGTINKSININENEKNIIKDNENKISSNEEIIPNIKKSILNNEIIEDDFDIKLNEELIIHRKENSKIKSDIFDSSDINKSSFYLKDKSNLNDNIFNNSQEKIKNQFQVDDIETNNEICNISNTNTHTENKNFNKSKETEIKEIKQSKENTIDKNKNEINNIKAKREKFKDEIRKTFNKNYLFDSLEGKIDVNYNNLLVHGNKKEKDHSIKINTFSNTSKTKMKILNHFMTDNPKVAKKENKNKSQKRCFYKISSANNFSIQNDENNDTFSNNDKNSFSNTNLAKIENIFIKGNKNYSKTKTENIQKKKLQLFIVDKNNDIYINQNKKENKKESVKNYDYLIGNNIIKNNLYDRIIDSNMITNFLNNTKNEPMFNTKNFSTIQYPNQNSKINLNINNIINFSLNKPNPKIKTDENDNNKNNSYNSINNNFVYERKNHIYLKKKLKIGNNSNNNPIIRRCLSNRINKKNNLKLNEMELIEPNVQICPVTLKKEQNKRTINIHKNVNNINDTNKDSHSTIVRRIKRLPKSLSTELINGKIIDKKRKNKEKCNTTIYNINNNQKDKTNFISEDLLNFIDCIKTNQEKEKIKEKKIHKKDVYNFNEIKYNKINTYREKNKKQNKNSSLIVDSFKRIYNYKLNNNNNNLRKETDKNYSIGTSNKNKNVDYKRLNELYLDYKIKDIKRNKLKNEQDSNRGITFVPNINKIINKKF